MLLAGSARPFWRQGADRALEPFKTIAGQGGTVVAAA